MPAGSSPKRERQYEHIKEGYEKRGKSEKTAEEIAARTVNKERAQAGETKGAKKSSRSPSSSAKSKRSSSRPTSRK